MSFGGCVVVRDNERKARVMITSEIRLATHRKNGAKTHHLQIISEIEHLYYAAATPSLKRTRI